MQEQLLKTGSWPAAWGFEIFVLVAGGGRRAAGAPRRRERLEWEHSRGPEVTALEGNSRGLKCVRAATGVVVCVWAWTRSPWKVGKFRWMLGAPDGGDGWGSKADVMVVMTLLAVVERIRRDRRK